MERRRCVLNVSQYGDNMKLFKKIIVSFNCLSTKNEGKSLFFSSFKLLYKLRGIETNEYV